MPSPRSRALSRIAGLVAGATLLAACGGGAEAAARGSNEATADAPAAQALPTGQALAKDSPEATAAWPRVGSYGCAETITRMRNGSYEFEFEPRGLVVLEAGGRYTDPFGVKGSYRTLASGDSAAFTGGLLDRATATPIEDEPDRIRIEIPTENRSRRWTCSLKDDA